MSNVECMTRQGTVAVRAYPRTLQRRMLFIISADSEARAIVSRFLQRLGLEAPTD
jgi:hypothetical protein